MSNDNVQPLRARRLSLVTQAQQYLLALVEKGTYRPGEQLPSEKELAAQLGISRPTLREALLNLEQEGVVVRKHGVGTFVAPGYDSRLESGLERLESILDLATRQHLQVQVENLDVQQVPANADPAFFDLGLCGPERKDLAARRDLCGGFKVPTLRNVARTAPYFHNGAFATLREAVDFYVRRDTEPGVWYPKSAEGVRKFDDLPPELAGSVNTAEVPYDRKEGGTPSLTPGEIDDVVAFLETLDDGYN